MESQTILIPCSKKTYLEEHHQITETGIGSAKLFLKSQQADRALDELERCCESLDKITKIYRASLRASHVTGCG